MGEGCNSSSRILVEESIADELVNRICEATSKTKVRNRLDPEVKIGTIINGKQLEKIRTAVDFVAAQGAHIVCGGALLDGSGAFCASTIV
jgi:acyl-CoA reductase-like NAD-dependent aldehyde dehydrogenase